MSLEKRIEAIESWARTSGVGTSSTALGYTTGELEGRLLKRIQALRNPVDADYCPRTSKPTKGVGSEGGTIVTNRRITVIWSFVILKTPTSIELRFQ